VQADLLPAALNHQGWVLWTEAARIARRYGIPRHLLRAKQRRFGYQFGGQRENVHGSSRIAAGSIADTTSTTLAQA
jgi:hypothetical protein